MQNHLNADREEKKQKFDIQGIKLIVGLGNIGKEYEKTRHNLGFEFVDLLAHKLNISLKEEKKFFSFFGYNHNIKLAKPTTMMNHSGKTVLSIMQFFRLMPEEIMVVHDDLDIKLGVIKIHFRKGPKIHNGVNSIEHLIHSKNFWRMRIGVDNRTTETRKSIQGSEYVLLKMEGEEYLRIKQALTIQANLMKSS